MSLREGLLLLAFTMPFVLYLYGKFVHGLNLQPSMSAYFWAANQGQCATFPMRTIFVGYLAAIGVGLYAYKGLTNLENTLLNLAAICAFFVAIFPERISINEADSNPAIARLFESCKAVETWAGLDQLPIHLVAAVTLFLLLAIVAWLCAEKSLEYLPTDHDPERFRKTYKIIAVSMLLFPLIGLAIAFLLGLWPHKVFFIEAAGVLTFGTYWTVKTRELKLSSLETDPGQAIAYAAKRKTLEEQADSQSGQ
jgi:hypothetical protein